MSDREEFHYSHVGDEDRESEEVAFRTTPATSPATQPELITQSDLQEIIEGWEEKFHKLTEGVRAIEQATEEVHAHMDIVMRDNRARESDQASTNNRIKQIQEGLARFMERCDPAHPTRLMSQVMRGLHWKRCLVYIDDILVFGNDFESALHNLELVLDRVAEYGLQLKSTKCYLFRTSVPFLGHKGLGALA